jgi:hypothetical protein
MRRELKCFFPSEVSALPIRSSEWFPRVLYRRPYLSDEQDADQGSGESATRTICAKTI